MVVVNIEAKVKAIISGCDDEEVIWSSVLNPLVAVHEFSCWSRF